MPDTPEILPLGLDGVLVRFTTQFSDDANLAAQALAAALEADPLPGQCEVAPGLGSVLLRFLRSETARADLVSALQERLAAPAPNLPAPRHFLVPACFGGTAGPQLTEVAQRAGRSETDIISELCSTELRVLALGFAPGQPYLGMLPAHWDMPRMPDLSPQVAPGTITTALRQIVLFAKTSPTGWRALGRCALRPFAPGAEDPFLLRPGDRLRFVQATEAEIGALEATGDPMGGAIRSFPK
ncbi:KipI family sensor histidine kinase inhibitor [Rhodobacter sp. JA431]|uniref:5-oxoprolinase subunit B family protein n=1 Tax=Rhodobacter sp. JA431 TaxID=570013 RepID=UPI000BCB7CDC|nr:carboxyltransferase domain-containing protein [Rhodobacter sp. JA431]SOC14229.1 KipI family sensor histidine kinase inhibitor [Rhodobacter sp. JA431]